jgi:prepilin-type N-terminal cleavage/methylation domain-containing protein
VTHETRRGLRGRATDDAGFTLVELMVAATVLVVGVLGVLTLITGANAATASTRARENAVGLGREVLEAARGVGYDDLSTTALATTLQAQPKLGDADSTRSGWQVTRGTRTFTVAVTACAVDDGTADGFGAHSSAVPYCSNSTTQGTADANPDDYRRVAINVSWRIAGKTGTVRQEATINNPGSAYASAVRSLVPTTPALTAPYLVSSPLTTSVVFTAQTTGIPSFVRWYVDNLSHGNATGSATTWNFTWDLTGVVDGTYTIGAEAFDADNESGASRSVTVTVNRAVPQQPTGLAAGRNGSNGVEFEWNPNPERDITGYRVYQMVGAAPAPASDVKACETSTGDANPTQCRSTTAPMTGSYRYYVVALAPARPPATGTELSATPALAQTVLVDSTNVAPNPPQSISANRQGGTVTITWSAPAAPAAGESTDTLRYFRIYRDGTAYANRVDTTGAGTASSWIDFNAGDTVHTYYVTAVDSHMAESPVAPTGGIVK